MIIRKKNAAIIFIPSLLLIFVITVVGSFKSVRSVSSPNIPLTSVTKIIDGDTFDLSDGRRIRLWGVDAPEKRQSCFSQVGAWPCGIAAAEWLEEAIMGKDIRCEDVNVDGQNRIVAKCYLNGSDIAEAMVRAGWARDWQKYSGGAYASYEQIALDNRSGVYRD